MNDSMAAKSTKKRKAQAQARAEARPVKTARPLSPPESDETFTPRSLQTVTSTEELEITVDTLRSLAEYPAVIKSRPCRDLRVAVHDFRQACTTGANAAGTNLTARITAALADGQYTDARVLLAEMRLRGEVPKLGSMCRWVRDLDIISGLSGPSAKQMESPELAAQRSAEEKDRLLVLDAVLRTTHIIDPNLDALRPTTATPAIHLQAVWDLQSPTTAPEPVYASVLDKTLLAHAPANPAVSLPIIETTPAAQRKPPNHHDAVLYTSLPGAVPLTPEKPPTLPPIHYHRHPVVPGLGLATNVLSPDECKAIIAAGESVGFLPDAPVREDGDVSILAHNFYWVVDTAFHDALWARIRPHVPATHMGRVARGINRRFRVYRYIPGAEYRCHIDGAWPPSGIRAADQTYVYDASPPDKKQSSLFTFLVYLNDEFEGGETTFFLPAGPEGTLNAYPVRPVMGAVAIFPHGEAQAAVLHEGTGVRKGAKYVIRTDVEYDVEATE